MKSFLLSAAKSLATGNRFRARASLAIAVIAAGTALTPSVSQAVIHWSGELNLPTIAFGPAAITDLNGNGEFDQNEGILEVVVDGRVFYVSVRGVDLAEFAVSEIVTPGSVIDSNLHIYYPFCSLLDLMVCGTLFPSGLDQRTVHDLVGWNIRRPAAEIAQS